MSRTRLALRAVGVTAVAVMAAVIGSDTVHAQTNLTLTAGSAVYSSDAFCLDSGAALTNFGAGIDGSVVGGELMFSNGAWPWPCPLSGCGGGNAFALAGFSGAGVASQPANYLTHGNAFSGVVKFFPVPIIRRLGLDGVLGRADQFVRPYIGAGVQVTTDGETAPASAGRDLPTYSVMGRTDIVLTYGASLLLPGRDSRFGVVLEYRGAQNFADDIEIRTDTGDVEISPDNSLKWGQWALGFRYRLGS